MSDQQWKDRVSKINDPLVMLQEVKTFSESFSLGDPYYRDLEHHLFENIDRVLQRTQVKP